MQQRCTDRCNGCAYNSDNMLQWFAVRASAMSSCHAARGFGPSSGVMPCRKPISIDATVYIFGYLQRRQRIGSGNSRGCIRCTFYNPNDSQHRNGGRFKRAQRRPRSSDDTHGEMQQHWRPLTQQLHERLLQLDSLHSAALWRVIYLPLWRDCGAGGRLRR